MRASLEKESALDLSYYRDWVAKREGAREKDKTKRTFFVTISREYGCEGYEVATKLIDRLNKRSDKGWSLFTHKNLEEMAASDEMDADMVHAVTEMRWSFKDWFVDALVPKYLKSPSSKVFEKIKNLTLNLADKGNCVFLGGGAQVVTHRLDPKKFLGIHIRIGAAHAWRVNHIESISNFPREEAEKTLEIHQDARNEFIEDFTGLDASDPALYHVIFNNAKNGPDVMVDMIEKYLELNGVFDD